MLTVKRDNDPVMVVSVMDPDMKVLLSSLFFFSDLGKAMQRQLNFNLDGFLSEEGKENGVLYLLHPADDEAILTFEEQFKKPVAPFEEDIDHATN